MNLLTDFTYLIAASLFILGIKFMSTPKTARRGNFLAALGMLLAVAVTFLDPQLTRFGMILAAIAAGTVIGIISAKLVQMTAMPQMVAIFNGFGGLASALVSWAALLRTPDMPLFMLITVVLGTLIGAVTFSGSFIAFGKLQGFIYSQPLTYPLQNISNLLIAAGSIGLGVIVVLKPEDSLVFGSLLGLSLLLGVLMVLPIGGADMPVIISLLNSFSGVAAAMTGFVLLNKVLIVSGSLVGAAGLILTQIMCRAMNRSLANVMFGAFGKIEAPAAGSQGGSRDYVNVKSTTPEETSMILDGSGLVIMVPGYGLAVSRAQHSLKELAEVLQKKGTTVKYAIHPVAGRMPGHMNVLLAEAEVPYDQLFEMDEINAEFERADAVIVVGANDVTNPAARNEPGSPIYGMPILNVDKARSIIVIKRSLSPGFAGIKNPLFENDKTMMLYGDAKAMLDGLVKELKSI